MKTRLRLQMLPQPDAYTCGPTCLHALYGYYGERLDLPGMIKEIERTKTGGTLGVTLAVHALRRGYDATIYTYNLQVFDPTWFEDGVDIAAKLRAQMRHKDRARLLQSSRDFLEFLRLGGKLRQEDLTPALIRRYLKADTPILTGLSATYLYGCAREHGPADDYDDVRGEPAGHFVVLCGYHQLRRTVAVIDPLQDNPRYGCREYEVSIDRLVCAIMLGVLTYDANMIVIRPRPPQERRRA